MFSSNATMHSRKANTSTIKMGWNPRVNLAHHGFEPGWVEFFQYWLIFDLVKAG